MPEDLNPGSWSIRRIDAPCDTVITSIAAPPDGSARMMYADHAGIIRVIDRQAGTTGVFLDLRSKVVLRG